MSEAVATPAVSVGAAQVDAKTPEVQAKSPVPEAPKKIKIADYEFESENAAKSEIERGRQSGKLLTEAQKRLEAAANKDKEFSARKKAAKADFGKALEALELTREEAIELASKWLYDTEIAPKQMSPEARRAREFEEENKRLKAENSERERKTKSEAFEKQVQEETVRLRQELEGLLNEKKIPGTRVALKRLAMYLKSYEETGTKVPAARAVDMLMADYQQEFGELLDGASPEQLENFLGKERMQKLAKNISKWALSKLKGVTPKATEGTVKQITQPGQKDKRLSPTEFNKFLGELT